MVCVHFLLSNGVGAVKVCDLIKIVCFGCSGGDVWCNVCVVITLVCFWWRGGVCGVVFCLHVCV